MSTAAELESAVASMPDEGATIYLKSPGDVRAVDNLLKSSGKKAQIVVAEKLGVRCLWRVQSVFREEVLAKAGYPPEVTNVGLSEE